MKHRNIFTEWWAQFRSPWKHLSFSGYFIGFTIIVGCVGIYPSIYRTVMDINDWWNIVENVLTYSIALIMPACVTLILKSYEKTEHKSSLIIFAFLFFVLLPLGLCIMSYLIHSCIPAIICLFLAWFTWVLANHDNVCLQDVSYDENIRLRAENNSKDW